MTLDGGPPDLTVVGALDLYSGSFGLAKSLLKEGAPWVLTYEWNRSALENLLLPDVQQKIMSMLGLGCFSSVSLAPICASFSTAVTPPLRTTRHPRGRPGLSKTMTRKVGEGNLRCIFCGAIADYTASSMTLALWLKTLTALGCGDRRR